MEPGPCGPPRGAGELPPLAGLGPGLAVPSASGAPPGTAGPGPWGGGCPSVPGAGRGTSIHPPSPLPCLGEDGGGDPLGFFLGGHTLRAPQGLTCGRLVVIPPCAHSLGSLSLGAASGDSPASSDPASALGKLPHANSSEREPKAAPCFRCQRHLGGDHHPHLTITPSSNSGCLANSLPEVESPMQPTLGCLGWHSQVAPYSGL